MGNQMWHMLPNCPTPGKSDGSRLLRELDRGPDFTDTDQNLRAQVGGRRVAAAVLGHEPLDRLLQAVLAQAGAAFVQMLTNLRAVHVADLAVEIAVDPLQYLGTRSLMWLSAAHRASSPGRRLRAEQARVGEAEQDRTGFVERARRGVRVHHQHPLGPIADVHAVERDQAPHEQAGRDGEHERKGDFGDDEPAAVAPTSMSTNHPALPAPATSEVKRIRAGASARM